MPKRSFGLAGTHHDPRDSWVIEETLTLDDGRTVQKDQEVEISGERGRYVFLKHVLTETSEWIDVVGTGTYGAFHSFKPERIKKVYAYAPKEAASDE